MRCKNCGTDNDDNRYICENCGSPLYDETEFNENEDNSATKAFAALKDDDTAPNENNNEKGGSNYSKAAEKKSIIVIAILAVVLVAIIISVVLAVSANNKESSSTTESTTQSTTEQSTNEYTTESTTESTTQSTTESTTKEKTTEIKVYSIKVISKGGGTVEGSGNYEDGENVTIVATPDANYEFDGWYSNGSKISSSTVYSFTATKDISISAVFTEVVTEDEPVEDMDGGME